MPSGLRPEAPAFSCELELDGEKVTKEERLLGELRERIRDVRTRTDGALYLPSSYNSAGRILRVTPAQ